MWTSENGMERLGRGASIVIKRRIIPDMLKRWELNPFLKSRFVGLIVILFAFAPGVFKESFWSDDYPALTDTNALAEHILRDGRPFLAAIVSLSFSLLGSPVNAWILRCLALLALILLYFFISNRVKGSRFAGLGIFSVAVAFCLPSFQMYIHWSVTWFFLWAALLGVYSFHFWSSRDIGRKVFAVILLTLALTIYPPTALFFFAVIAIENTLKESKLTKHISDVVQGFLLLIISGVVAIITVVISLQFASVSPSGRVALLSVSEIPKKILWLASRPLVVGLRPFMIDSPSVKIAIATALPVLVILVLGIRKQSLRLNENPSIRAFWVAVPLLISLTPLMITSDNQIEFRVLPGYCWGIATLSSYFLLEFLETKLNSLRLTTVLKRLSLFIAPLILSLVSVISINSHFSDLFGGPYQKKNAFLNESISACIDHGAVNRFVIIGPKMPFPTFQRLGVFSMSTDLASGWVPIPNLKLLLEQRSIKASVVYHEVRPKAINSLAQDCLIDLEEFRKLLA